MLYPHIKIICSGDFRQLAPVNDRVIDCNYKDSDVLHELSDGNRLQLTKCRRSDDILFNISKNVEHLDKSEFGNKDNNINICYFNTTRHRINKICMDRHLRTVASKNKSFKIDCGLNVDANYSIIVSSGMPIISKINKASDELYNNESFKIVKCSKNNTIELKNDLTNEILTVKGEEFNSKFDLGFCLTNYKAQGITIDKPYTIYDYDYMSKEGMYVCITRATKKELINFR